MTKGTYEIKNRLDGMAYGGSSGDIEQRWMAHLWMLRNDRHHCAHLQNAWNKYGEDVFEFSVLEVIEDPDERLAAEQAWLDIHHANKTCYNVAITAGTAGPMAEETKRRMSISHIGSKHSEQTKLKQSIAHLGELNPSWGKHHTEEAKQKRRTALKGKKRLPFTEEHKQNISKAKLGKKLQPFTEEHKRNISAAVKRWWLKKKAADAEGEVAD